MLSSAFVDFDEAFECLLLLALIEMPDPSATTRTLLIGIGRKCGVIFDNRLRMSPTFQSRV
jgi:hypothetical protein